MILKAVSFFLLALEVVKTQLVNFDEGCNEITPARCPRLDPYKYSDSRTFDKQSEGPCMKDYSACKIAQICFSSERTYQCPEGACADKFENCPYKNLDCLYKNQKRCPDGYCRRDCNTVSYSSCPMSTPLLCPHGACVKNPYQCAGGHYCNLNRPFLCPDMSCKVNVISCPATVVGRTFDRLEVEYQYKMEKVDKMISKLKTSNLEFNFVFDGFNAPSFSPFFGKKITRNAKMFIEPVSLGDLRLVQNTLNSTLAAVVKQFYMISEEVIPYHITVRSSGFKVSTEGRWDDFEVFKTPISVRVSINSIRRGENPVSNLSVVCIYPELPVSLKSHTFE